MSETTEKPVKEKLIITVPAGGVEFRGEGGELLASIEPLTGGGAAFTVSGGAGQARAFLWSGDGDAGVSFRTATGAVMISAGPNGGSVSVDGPTGTMGVSLSGHGRGGEMVLHGAGMNAAVSLDAGEDGAGRAFFCNGRGDVLLGLLAVPDGGLVRTLTAAGKPAAELGASGEDGALIVWDKSGAKSFAVPVWKFTGDGQKPDAS